MENSYARRVYEHLTQEELAERNAIGYTEFVKEDVEYKVYEFSDGSKITFGNNGYIGMEEKA